MRHVVVTIALCFAACPAFADTLTLRDGLSINGTLVGLVDGSIAFKARFVNGEKELAVPIGSVEIIEFNSTLFNAGGPPRIVGSGPSTAAKTPVAPVGSLADAVVLRGG